ncbi:hypothetical protein OS493_014522 [Desmophyllum pertusum]|uniref:Peptidase S8 pro-domain domain-containing protein n=1 Tax=Desmophyllum pertusum TaxID=174260 RepID=A0A9W9YPQ3_9CNID|nr:hypothetical protein OS493_014522 [Desmophyllum pertusum]
MMAGFSCSILLIIFLCGTEILAREIYTNVWAVKVRGSRQEVEEIALKYGFSYDTHLFEDYHLFKRPGLKKTLGKTRLSSEIDKKLDLDSKVEWFMHQKEKKYQLFSSDPMFEYQWYIVS